MKLNPIYDYAPLDRKTSKSGPRTYTLPNGAKVPSVTTILSQTKDMTFLKEWKERMGEERANKIVKRSTSLGTGVHKNLERYILEGAEPEGDIFAQAMTKKIIKNGFPRIDEVWGVEISLYAENLYAGTADAVGLFEGTPAIIDFKNSRSFRQEEWVHDYKLQCVAYSLAHNELFNTDIKKGVIMLATQQGHYQEWIIENEEYDEYCEKWAERVQEYYAKYK